MRDATEVIAEAVNGHTEKLAELYEVSTPRMYQLLSTHCPYGKSKMLIRAIAQVSQRGARLIRADLDALFDDILTPAEDVSASELNRECFEAVNAILENKPVAVQKKELRDVLSKAGQKLEALNENGHREVLPQGVRDAARARRGR